MQSPEMTVVEDLPERISGAILQAYEALPKTGKPQSHEYTVLAGTYILDPKF